MNTPDGLRGNAPLDASQASQPAAVPPPRNGGPTDGAVRRTVLITNPQGFHMRPKAAFAALAGRFQCAVNILWEGQAVNGKSMWDLMLVAALPGSEVTVEAAGPDAAAALDALAAVLSAVDDAPASLS